MNENKYEYLQDATFLKYFDLTKLKKQYAKIIILDWEENPIKEILTIVTDGSINFDGNSSLRRTGNLSLSIQKIEDVEYYLSINKKINIEIGFENNTPYYQNYNRIWFPMGLFVIVSNSISRSNTGISISLQIKDKMCLLNGECGGTFPAAVTFDQLNFINELGNVETSYVPVYQIIQELVHHWGGEPLEKIIISDIDNKIKKVMKWTGSAPLYLAMDLDGDTSSYLFTLDENSLTGVENPWTKVSNFDLMTNHTYVQYSYGEDIGYVYTDFIFTGGDLIGNSGQTVCNILDNIKNLLGNYEYFYDINGNFVFREIKNYLNTTQVAIELENLQNEDYKINQSQGKSIYNFDNSELIISYNNTPNYEEIKNDFVIWGKKKTTTGLEIPIRYHLAIDSKPETGIEHEVFRYTDPTDGIEKAKTALKFNNYSSFPEVGVQGVFYYDEENTDIYGWSESSVPPSYYLIENVNLESITSTDWRTELYLNGVDAEPFGEDSNYYYPELSNEWPQLYDIWNGTFKEEFIKYPSECNYFLDFIDSTSDMGAFSVSNIGRRTYTEEITDVNCIFAPSIPDLVLIESGTETTSDEVAECIDKGYNYSQVSSEIYSSIASGGNLYAAFDAIKTILYKNTQNINTISIQCLPIYYLDVNTRISVTDIESHIFGDYMINSFQISLNPSGTMTINASKAVEYL